MCVSPFYSHFLLYYQIFFDYHSAGSGVMRKSAEWGIYWIGKGTEEIQKEDNDNFLKSCIRPVRFRYNEGTDVLRIENVLRILRGKGAIPVQGSFQDHVQRQVTAFARGILMI